MKRLIKLLAVAALVLSIPIQGFAAVMMSACNTMNMHQPTSVAMIKVSYDGVAAGQQVSTHHCCVHDQDNHCQSEQKCSICHLSVFHLPVIVTLHLGNDASNVYHDLINQQYHTVHPPLFHPPKQHIA